MHCAPLEGRTPRSCSRVWRKLRVVLSAFISTHGDGLLRHFHLKITASVLEKPLVDSETELFRKIPDVDSLYALRNVDDQFIVVTMRGIGEMELKNPNNFEHLDH